MSKLFGLIVVLVVLCAAGSILAVEETTSVTAEMELASGSMESTSVKDTAEPPLSLSRDQEGTVMRSFTIEGEDRVSIKFDRPNINLDLDPRSAPGLGWQNAWEKVNVFPAITTMTAVRRTSLTGKPWLQEYAQGDVVVFHPEAPELTSWKLTIVDSRGKPAMVREGKGTPPGSLVWDGRRDDGHPAWPGLTYSFLMETVDIAGNARTVSGRGFDLPAYRLTGAEKNVMVFSGGEITSEDPAVAQIDLSTTPLIIETASWLNQAPGLTEPIEIRATVRNRGQGRQLADLVHEALAGMVCGDPSRISVAVNVVGDAPDQGVIEIACIVGD